MKFTEHLGAHLTPEWRSQYIQYEVCDFVNAMVMSSISLGSLDTCSFVYHMIFLLLHVKCQARPVPTVGCRGVSHPPSKCSVCKTSNLPFLSTKSFTFLYLWNIRRRIRCYGVTESSLISYIYPWNLLI